MPTPLETFIRNLMHSPIEVALDCSRLAVGTDNQHASPLLAGVRWMMTSDRDSNEDFDLDPDDDEVAFIPNCFSFALIVKGGVWSEQRNLNWVRAVVSRRDGEQPLVCHVFHTNVVDALIESSRIGGRCTPRAFTTNYRGNRSTSFKEVQVILGAGYRRVTTLQYPGHAMLWPD